MGQAEPVRILAGVYVAYLHVKTSIFCSPQSGAANVVPVRQLAQCLLHIQMAYDAFNVGFLLSMSKFVFFIRNNPERK